MPDRQRQMKAPLLSTWSKAIASNRSDAAADFAISYADQNDRDYEALHSAARSGRIAVETGV